MCFVWFSEQMPIISLNSFNKFIFILNMNCVVFEIEKELDEWHYSKDYLLFN
jgi:hypothetical protein